MAVTVRANHLSSLARLLIEREGGNTIPVDGSRIIGGREGSARIFDWKIRISEKLWIARAWKMKEAYYP